jgi:diguanylate cyclase (GGDEF)-like protein/PAS domain S-box-containing protein
VIALRNSRRLRKGTKMSTRDNHFKDLIERVLVGPRRATSDPSADRSTRARRSPIRHAVSQALVPAHDKGITAIDQTPRSLTVSPVAFNADARRSLEKTTEVNRTAEELAALEILERPASILIVDDRIQNQELLKAMLRPEGYRVLAVANGEEALASIGADAPDLILLDVKLPGMDGCELARLLKADSSTSNIPIIMVTAHTDALSRVNGLSAGAEEFLAQPVNQTELWLRVRNLLRLKALGDLLQNHSSVLEHQVQARTANLHDSEQRFRQMADHIRDAFFLIDADTWQILYVSLAYEAIWGRSCDSLYADSLSWNSAVHPDDRARVTKTLMASTGTGQFDEEYRILRPAGDVRWVRVRGYPITDDTSKLRRIAGIAVDITARKEAEQELQESERRFSDLLKNVELASVMLDCNAQITYCNEYLLRLTGWQLEEVIGRNWFDLFVPPELGDVRPLFTGLLANQPETWHRDNEIVIRNGERRLMRWNNSVLRSITGEVVGTASIGEDITEQTRSETKIRRLNRIYAVLSGINTLIVRVKSRDELFSEACRISVEQGQFGIAWIGTFNPTSQTVLPVAWSGAGGQALAAIKAAAPHDVSQGTGSIGRALRERRTVIDNHIAADACGGPAAQLILELDYRSRITLPLFDGESIAGFLTMYAREPGFFVEEEVTLLTEMAENISFALGHLGKEAKIARLSRIQMVMSGINSAIVRISERRQLLAEACRIAVEDGGFGIAWIGDFDAITQDITPVAWAGIDSQLTATRRSARADGPGGQGLASRAVREKTAVLDNDIAQRMDIGSGGRQEALRRGYRSLIALPLLVEGGVSGTLSLFAKEPDFFDAEELTLLTELAANIAFALEHIARQGKVEKLSRIRAVSGQINAAIVRTPMRNDLLKEVCRIAVEFGKFDLVWIGSLDQQLERIDPIAWSGFPCEIARAVSWPGINNSNATIEESVRTRKVTVRNNINVQATSGVLRAEALKRNCLSTVCLPLVVHGKVEAAIVLYAPGINFFDHDELMLLEGVASDISLALQSIVQREKLDYLAFYDSLTGLANRSLFLERVAQYTRSAISGAHKLAVGVFDLERFKNINDSLGRPAGDALLKQVAEWLTIRMGDASLVARISADQFAVVLPVVNAEGNVGHLLDKSIEAFLEHTFRLNDAVFRVAVKAGAALYPDDGADADTLFTNAEAALKKAKRSGDRYLFYTKKMTAAVAGRLTLETQLRQALENEEFVLHYQPKVNLRDAKLASAEALIRWNDPRTGLVAPAHFIPVLEETGLINEVGRWALRKATGDYLRWRALGLPAVRIAVNVSPLQLRNPGFISEVASVIASDAQAAAGLELEITETLIMADVKHSIASLKAIREMGVTIAIDDFGTGFSSLSYLAKLPVDTLKIDRSFVIDMTESPEGLALVSTIINLAHSLKLKVVAEGVETEEQSSLLRLLNCDEMQGYLFSKPLPAETFESRFLLLPPING